MVTLPPRPQGHPIWRSPLFEWGTLALVVCVVVLFVWREARQVQMLAESSAVQTNLRQLRTALINDYLQGEVQRQQTTKVPRALENNPFLLLDKPLTNYAGVVPMGAVSTAQQGTWVFDPACPCVGYLPLFPGDLVKNSDVAVLWFRVVSAQGPRKLEAWAEYRWAGVVIR